MFQNLRSGVFLAALSVSLFTACIESPEVFVLNYPEARKSDQIDEYHGSKVADPYRWLEDPSSKETRKWIEAENKLTQQFLGRIPERDEIRDRLKTLWNYERYSIPRERAGKFFFEKNDGLQNQAVLYVADSMEAEPRVLLDPNKWSDDGTADLAGWTVSHDGSMVAYGVSKAGSDWREWRVIEVDTGRKLLDQIQWVKFSGVSWAPKDRGLYYSRYDEPEKGEEYTGANYYQKLYYHPLGEPQSTDKLIYERKDEKEWGFDGHVTDDDRYLIISVWRGTERKNQIFYRDLQDKSMKVVELITGWDAEYEFLGNDGSVFYLMTDNDAPLRRVIAVDTEKPDRENWRELIPAAKETLEDISLTGDKFFASYLKDAHTVVRTYDLQGKPGEEVELPGLGTAGGFRGRRDATRTFYSFSNYTTPTTIFSHDLKSGETKVFRAPKVDFDPSQYVTKQIFCKSKDGAKVPMFVTHKKGLELDGSNPTILYGYGGFNISLTPWFSVSNLVWLERGGVYVVANLRGGGEYGRDWHEAGMKANKQNVFDDFIAAAEHLIEQKYTSPEHLAIRGGSNGGLLVGAAMTQRPDLFAAANPAVGVMDMLRFHKFTIGYAWASEYGSSDNAEEFETLKKYSPLHNLKSGESYPATLVTTGDHDDRVVPAHSFKFAATLQAAQAKDGPPVLIRIETSAGHGAGKPVSKIIDETADVLAFISHATARGGKE